MTKYHRVLMAGAALAIALPSAAFAASEPEKAEIEAIIRDYLIRNPEVLLEAMDALEAKRAAEQQVAQKKAIADAGPALFDAPEALVIGNPEGDVTLVEFFDYNCGYCKRALSDMDALVQQDPQLRFVLKEMPVLGPDSVAAHRVSLAFREVAPQRYGEFHRELLGSRGLANEERALEVARDLGVEETALRQAMASPAIDTALAEGQSLATLLNITGTPSYVISDEVVVGAVGLDALSTKIDNVRRCDSTTC